MTGFLFDRQNPVPADEPMVIPSDTHVTEPTEIARLSSQNQQVLVRLQQRPATNRELATISLKYTSRISDLREAGHRIEVVEHDRKTGLVLYQLFSEEGASR
jgi:hypothetical protein